MPNPKKPVYLVIGGMKWELVRRTHARDDAHTFGETHMSHRTITVFEDIHQDHPASGDLESTLFHETIHAALKATGLCELLGKNEEALVSGLENALWPIIQLRPSVRTAFKKVRVTK